MINKKLLSDDEVQITFALDEQRPVSLVGDFNGWDPLRHPLIRRSDGLRSVAVVATVDSRLSFRYLADPGEFFDDPDAEIFEDNGFGSTHGVVIASLDPPGSELAVQPELGPIGC